MRTKEEILHSKKGSMLDLYESLEIDHQLSIVLSCMEEYAANKQERIDELEYKLSTILSNIYLTIGECDRQITIATDSSQIDVMEKIKKILEMIKSIPPPTTLAQ